MDTNDTWTRAAYLVMAAVSGAITSLSLVNWKRMSRTEIGMTVFVGTTFALFVVPWLAMDILKLNSAETLRTACGLTYLGGTMANAIIPALIKKFRKGYNLEDEA